MSRQVTLLDRIGAVGSQLAIIDTVAMNVGPGDDDDDDEDFDAGKHR